MERDKKLSESVTLISNFAEQLLSVLAILCLFLSLSEIPRFESACYDVDAQATCCRLRTVRETVIALKVNGCLNIFLLFKLLFFNTLYDKISV